MPRYTFLDSYHLTSTTQDVHDPQPVPPLGLGYASNVLRELVHITASSELIAQRADLVTDDRPTSTTT